MGFAEAAEANLLTRNLGFDGYNKPQTFTSQQPVTR
jgi:hypothetical protein